jgi:hypothetical protein
VLDALDSAPEDPSAEDGSIYHSLFGLVGDDRLEEVFFDRFRENLLRFLASPSPAAFEALEAVFVPNIQLSHESTTLLEEAARVLDKTAELRTSLRDSDSPLSLVPGSEESTLPSERKLLEILGEAQELTAILDLSPYEPSDTLELIADMCDNLHLRRQDSPAEEPSRPSLRFTGPNLSHTQARQKIEVTNEVLLELARAYDRKLGRGCGRSRIQVLVDGSPAEHALVFYQAEVDMDGTVSPSTVLRNLGRRPEPEHRRVLNMALSDLVERVMSAAAQELPEGLIEEAQVAVAGYRQRLGL